MYRKLTQISTAFVLAISTLLAITASTASAFTCPSGAGYDTWTNTSSSNFNSAGNWSGGVPTNGENLVFNNTSLGSTITVTNDLTGLSLGNITFCGTGTHGFTIAGNSITLSHGIDVELPGNVTFAGGNTMTIDTSLTLSANQTFLINNTAPGSGNTVLDLGQSTDNPAPTLALGTHSLTINSSTATDSTDGIYDTISGSGSLNFNNNLTIINHATHSNSSAYTGPIFINSGAVELNIPDGNATPAIGTGTVTVASGGTLLIGNIQGIANFNLPNNLNLSGTGTTLGASQHLNNPGALDICYIDVNVKCGSANVTVSGKVTLNGNATINSVFPLSSDNGASVRVTLTGTLVTNGFALTATTGSDVVIVNNATVINPVVPTKPAPKAPNTGSGLIFSKPVLILGITVICTIVLASLATITKRQNSR